MSWRDQQWLEVFLPNYLKPLRDPNIETDETKEFVKEAEEFLSDLASLSELPRINKTFKRSIKGYLYKVKIKPKKLHLELVDSKKSPTPIKKRVYITIYRKQYKTDKGMGKCIDSTIYYQIDNRTIVRNIRKHPYFQRLFLLLHQLDMSLSGIKVPDDSMPTIIETPDLKTISEEKEQIQQSLLGKVKTIRSKYGQLDPLILTKLNELHFTISACVDNIELLDIEEKHHLNRLVNNDLPNLLETFSSLTKDQQRDSFEEVVGAIHSMRVYVENLDYELKSTKMDRMKQLLKLNEIRYEQNIPKKRG